MKYLNLPQFDIKIRDTNVYKEVLDIVRGKWIKLTPEEWVRQHVINYLISEKKYPKSLIAVEMPIKLNGMNRRCDVVVYSRQGNPFLIVECKAYNVKITQKVIEQIANYNTTLKAPYLLVTNGLTHYYYNIIFKDNTVEVLAEIPNYSDSLIS